MYKLMYLSEGGSWHVYLSSRSKSESRQLKKELLRKIRSGELVKYPAFAGTKFRKVMVVKVELSEEV